MAAIVIDASVVVELLLQTRRAAAVSTWLTAAASSLHAPHLLDLEVASAIRSFESRRQVSSADATRAMQELLALPLSRYPHDPMIPRLWQLRGQLTPYDAAYVALAEHLCAPLVTCDGRLARARGHRASIQLVP